MKSQGEITESFHQALPLWNYTFPFGDWVQAVSVNKDGSAIVAGTRYSHVQYFNRTGTVLWRQNGITDTQIILRILQQNLDTPHGISGIAVSADDNYTGIVTARGQNAYYDRNGTSVWGTDWSTIRSQGRNVAISDDGRYFIAGVGYRHNNVIFYDLQHLTQYFNRGSECHDTWHYTTYNSIGSSGLNDPSSGPNDPTGVHVAISSDGQYIVAVSEDSRVYYFDQSGKVLWNNITGNSLENVAMSSDGHYIAAASQDYNVYFFNETGFRLWNYTTGDIVKSVAVNTDGQYLAAGSDDRNIYLLNRDGTLLWKYLTGAPVKTVAMSREGQTIVAGSADHTIYCFDQSGTLLWKYTTGNMVNSVAVSGDGNYVAAGSNDGNVYFFNREGSP
ncbi:MAG: WD40 repeat domain-containing protein [Methanocalculus sp.]|nr:WD40 repeat domain-containing protein [Methanocalculus sp.]MDO9539815.1 WD40 repeat domain-containing protein [Methanocalculus sp.]